MLDLQQLVVDETAHFWVLNKPAGIAVNDESDTAGLVTQFKYSLQERSDVDVHVYPVHRLDKGTSGLVLFAKHTDANRVLSNAFQKKEIEKRYLAITSSRQGKKPKKKQGWVKGDMVKSRNGNWKLCNCHENPARTYFESASLGDHSRLCMIKPVTGKTHQIRVAMRSLSMPIVGDERYGGSASDRMYLHAFELAFYAFGEQHAYRLWPEQGRLFIDLEQPKFAPLIESLNV